MTTEPPLGLRAILEHGRRLGFIGAQANLDAELAHAAEFGIVASGLLHCRVADLGSGAGLPGLVLAHHWPTAHFTLIESASARAGFLERAVVELGWSDRVTVLHRRVELVARCDEQRGQYDVVTARSFGRAAVVAECGAPLLREGGQLVVSEPPDAALLDRWPPDRCAELGLSPAVSVGAPHRFVILERVGPVPDGLPRRPGIPQKRPRW